jgi:hypothetical protein
LHSTRGRGMNWLRFCAELLAMRRWWSSTSIEELEVEDWVDSLPPSSSSTASSDDGARVLARAQAAACDGGTQAKLTSGGGETRAVHGRSSGATLAGHGRLRLRRGSRRRLGLIKARVCECWPFRLALFRPVCWRVA